MINSKMDMCNRQKTEIEAHPGHKYSVLDIQDMGHSSVLAIKAQNNQTGEFVAIKVHEKQALAYELDIERRKQKQTSLYQEILRNRKLTGHPCVLSFKEVFITPSFFCIVTELPQGGTVFDYVQNCQKNSKGLSQDQIRNWFQQLILFQKFCHENGFVKRNFKLENTFCYDCEYQELLKCGLGQTDENFWNLKICDFRFVEDALNKFTSYYRPLYYASPEILFREKNSPCDGYKVEVWACGIALYYLLTAKYPFDYKRQNISKTYMKMKTGEFKFPKDCQIPVGCKILVARMLDRNPKTRFSFQQIIDDSWFRVNLPSNWDQSFQENMKEMQKDLQSESEIEYLINEVFKTSHDIDLEHEMNMHEFILF